MSGRLRLAGERVFRLMNRSWADWPLGSTPAWNTDITDDGTPFEFSIAFDRRAPKLRMLLEAQERPLTLASSWDAGLRLNERLRDLESADLERFERIRDLFAPTTETSARYALWHAAVLEEGAPATYKVYVNPQVEGPQGAKRLVIEALERLDVAGAPEFMRSLGALHEEAQLVYFSLDLAAGSTARVKVYVAHPGAKAEDVERALEGTSNYVSGEPRQWIDDLLGDGPFRDRPILTCFGFTSSGEPPVGTLHLPIRSYTRDDESGLDRILRYLSLEDGRALRSALNLFGERALKVGRGLLTYVSLRRSTRGLSVTTYMAPEAFAVTPPRLSWPQRQ